MINKKGFVSSLFACLSVAFLAGGLSNCNCNEIKVPEICNNNLDDDGNGAIDCLDSACTNNPLCTSKVPENCTDHLDNDGDGAIDCMDADCKSDAACQVTSETGKCYDGLDNDHDGKVDCVDPDCAGDVHCISGIEICGDGIDNDSNGLTDCDDPMCYAFNVSCGREVCGDGFDNDYDGFVDCADPDCAGINPPCGPKTDPATGQVLCSYRGEAEHTCECNNLIDDDPDNHDGVDGVDIHCFSPFDDDEGSYATGIPGDNKGSKAATECPFDGNSGIGNDDTCCNNNPDNWFQNMTPNGCDSLGCCEIDVNKNGTGEHVYIMGSCNFGPSLCDQSSKLSCPCTVDTVKKDCGPNQFCVMDHDQEGKGFCSTCTPCTVSTNANCVNPCECGEVCFGGFKRPVWECTVCNVGVSRCQLDGSCLNLAETCINGCCEQSTCESACPATPCNSNEQCVNGCCYAACAEGVTYCTSDANCNISNSEKCFNGCCAQAVCPEGTATCASDANCNAANNEKCLNNCCAVPLCAGGATACTLDANCPTGQKCFNGCCAQPTCPTGVDPCIVNLDCPGVDTGYVCISGCCIKAMY